LVNEDDGKDIAYISHILSCIAKNYAVEIHMYEQ